MTAPAGLLDAPFAHRGLWTSGRPENTLAAFEAACDGGYGVELDVQLSADGEAMVFHDDTLRRLTPGRGLVARRTAAELTALPVQGSDQTIPTLAQTLDRVAGRAFLLIELKTPPGEEGPLESRVAALTLAYDGPFALIGFNAGSHAWLARHHPGPARGFTAQRAADLKQASLAQPQFLNIRTDLLADPMVRSLRAEGLPVIAWTVRSAAEAGSAAPLCDGVIFEGFRP